MPKRPAGVMSASAASSMASRIGRFRRDAPASPAGMHMSLHEKLRLYLDGKLQGTIEKWNLTFDWDPARVLLVLGAAYVGHIDDLAVFDRPLTPAEVELLYGLRAGARELYP